ncbi:MAG: hypothetical protein K9L64_07055 [Candidatus Izimaplasma sp.]|nr:hypothetical protein [Candidatus Izimaplasma bacterium]
MKNDTLLYFSKPNEFLDFIDSLKMYNGWTIRSGTMNNRGETIRDRSYTETLRELFRERKLFRRNVSIAEIVSWLDNFVYMKRILKELEKQVGTKLYNKTEIYVEYKIRMSKMMRIDYILKYDDKICLLEFRTLDNFDKLRSTWSKKKTELLIYKELMQNYIFGHKFLTYAFIGVFEYHRTTPIQNHIEHNYKQVEYYTKYLRLFMYGFSE